MKSKEKKEKVNNSLTKIREIILQIPVDYKSKKFIGGNSYKIIFWNVNNTGLKNHDYIEKISEENRSIIFGGMEGLDILRKFSFQEIPSGKEIYSLRKNKEKDTPYLKKCGKKYSLLFPDRIMPVGSIIVSFEKV